MLGDETSTVLRLTEALVVGLGRVEAHFGNGRKASNNLSKSDCGMVSWRALYQSPISLLLTRQVAPFEAYIEEIIANFS